MSTLRTVHYIIVCPTCVIGFHKIYIWSTKDAIFLTVRDKNCIYLFGLLFMSVLSFRPKIQIRSMRIYSGPIGGVFAELISRREPCFIQ
jgi:hypothetical protein